VSRVYNSDVRSTVLSTICITRTTLPFILERTRDVKESVRCATFKAITEKVELRQLSIEQRVKLLKDGLNDRYAVLPVTSGVRVRHVSPTTAPKPELPKCVMHVSIF